MNVKRWWVVLNCGHKSDCQAEKKSYKRERVRERSCPQWTQLVWGSQPCWTFRGLAKDSSHHKPSFFFFFLSQHCDDGLLPEPSAHPASLSLNLTKMKVYVSTQVGVTMETTVIQCSQQKQLYERSCLMELKSRLGPSFHAITTQRHRQPNHTGQMCTR